MTHDQQERIDALEIDIAGIREERDQLREGLRVTRERLFRERARVAELEAEIERLCERVAEAERSEDGPVRTSSADDPTGFQQIY